MCLGLSHWTVWSRKPVSLDAELSKPQYLQKKEPSMHLLTLWGRNRSLFCHCNWGLLVLWSIETVWEGCINVVISTWSWLLQGQMRKWIGYANRPDTLCTECKRYYLLCGSFTPPAGEGGGRFLQLKSPTSSNSWQQTSGSLRAIWPTGKSLQWKRPKKVK